MIAWALIGVGYLVANALAMAFFLYRLYVAFTADADQMHAECEGYGPVRR